MPPLHKRGEVNHITMSENASLTSSNRFFDRIYKDLQEFPNLSVKNPDITTSAAFLLRKEQRLCLFLVFFLE